MTGMQYYRTAFSYVAHLNSQGPLPSIRACFTREQRLERPPAWALLLLPGPRDDDGDLANTAAADLALALAFALADKVQQKLKLDYLHIGIVVSHNKTLYYAQEKLLAIWHRISNQEIDDLAIALTGMEPRDNELQDSLELGRYQITFVPGQSAISTDFDGVIVLNCFDNLFVRHPARHNVWN